MHDAKEERGLQLALATYLAIFTLKIAGYLASGVTAVYGAGRRRPGTAVLPQETEASRHAADDVY